MKLKSFALLILLPLLTVSPVYAAKPTPSPTPAPSTKTICVDAGHGGSDTGATYQNLTERDITLDIAQRLQTLLQSTNGYSVVMTRTDNVTSLGNTDRANICNAAHADYLVSIHLNGSTNHSIDYTQGLYGKQNKDKAWAQKINNSMAQLGSTSGIGTITNNGITNYADGMLLKATMPATLAETVFISSDSEYGLLNDGTYLRQQAIAQALFNGITSQ